MAGPHRRPQDRRVGGPARRGVGRGPARAGHRPAGHRHRVPRAPRPRRGRVAAAHRADRAGAGRRRRGGRGQPGGGARQAVVLPRPRHAEPAGRRRSARSASASCWPASSGCARCWPPRACSTPRASDALPFLPGCIGLITGRASAAEHDVVADATARWPAVRFRLRAHRRAGRAGRRRRSWTRSRVLDRDPAVDVIVLARGGGSVEDLLPFSDETLCRAVAACRTPVVSAIGHEPDTPLVDHVADLRCSTPTEAGGAWCPTCARRRPGWRGCATGPGGRWPGGWTARSGCSRPCDTGRCWPIPCVGWRPGTPTSSGCATRPGRACGAAWTGGHRRRAPRRPARPRSGPRRPWRAGTRWCSGCRRAPARCSPAGAAVDRRRPDRGRGCGSGCRRGGGGGRARWWRLTTVTTPPDSRDRCAHARLRAGPRRAGRGRAGAGGRRPGPRRVGRALGTR